MLMREMRVLLRRHSEVVVVMSWRGCQAGLGGLIGRTRTCHEAEIDSSCVE